MKEHTLHVSPFEYPRDKPMVSDLKKQIKVKREKKKSHKPFQIQPKRLLWPGQLAGHGLSLLYSEPYTSSVYYYQIPKGHPYS